MEFAAPSLAREDRVDPPGSSDSPPLSVDLVAPSLERGNPNAQRRNEVAPLLVRRVRGAPSGAGATSKRGAGGAPSLPDEADETPPGVRGAPPLPDEADETPPGVRGASPLPDEADDASTTVASSLTMSLTTTLGLGGT